MSELKERKCTACGGTLTVEGNKAVCEYCGSTYDIDDGISIKEVSITNIGNLLKRGREYLALNNFKKAKEYLEKAKDIDIENQGAKVFEQELKEREENYFSAKDALDSIEYQEHLKEEEQKKKQKEIDKKIKDFGKVEEATLEKLDNTFWKSTTEECYYVFKNGMFTTIKANKYYDGKKEYTQWKMWWSKIEKIGHNFYCGKEYYRASYRPVVTQNKNNTIEQLDDKCLELSKVSDYDVKANYDLGAYHKFDIAGDKYLIEHGKARDSNYNNINVLFEYDNVYEKIDDLEAYKYFTKIEDIEQIIREQKKLQPKTKISKFIKPVAIFAVAGWIIQLILNAIQNYVIKQEKFYSHLNATISGSKEAVEQVDATGVNFSLIFWVALILFIAILGFFYVKKVKKLKEIDKSKETLQKEAIEIQKRLIEYKIKE